MPADPSRASDAQIGDYAREVSRSHHGTLKSRHQRILHAHRAAQQCRLSIQDSRV